jgi:hypothetical protein
LWRGLLEAKEVKEINEVKEVRDEERKPAEGVA